MRLMRRSAVIVAAIFLAALVLREAMLRSSLPGQPARAAGAWSGHPDAVIARGMVAIGTAARAHRLVGPELTKPVIGAYRLAPLSIEPFLVRGVELQNAGDEAGAGRAFLAAAQRDPRAQAPHYFLADHYTRSGKQALGLTELGKLIKLVPGASPQLAPRIAALVNSPGGAPAIHALVAENPRLRGDVVRALASDARNADLILTIVTPGAPGDWQPMLVQSLLAAGEPDRAFAIWARANRLKVSSGKLPLLNDPTFRLGLTPPFGWTLASGGAGAAEPAPGSGLHLLYYGRDPFTAASQMLVLAPGRYSLVQRLASITGDPTSLSWQVSCVHDGRKIASLPLASSAGKAAGAGQFMVPQECNAQRLDLVGAPADVPVTVDLTLSSLVLSPAS